MNDVSMAGQTILLSGGSRGIGLAVACKAASLGANIAFMAKTDAEDPRLPGTVHSAAEAIRAAGGQALPIVGDVRKDEDVQRAVARTVEEFGGIDILVNNASAISLLGYGELSTKRFDLIYDVNVRGTFVLTSAVLPHLVESSAPRVLTFAPPINLDPTWLSVHAPYTVSKYAMTLLTCGVAEQYRDRGLAANCLWPATLIATAAVQNVVGGDEGVRSSRRPEIMADAAALLLAGPTSGESGRCCIDEEVLLAHGVTDFTQYTLDGQENSQLTPDFFV